MKHHHLILVFALIVVIVLSGCTVTWPIKMDSKDFTKISDTKVSLLILKKGDTVYFGYDGGKLIEKQRNDTLFSNIVGYDTSETKLITIPLSDIQYVEGKQKEMSLMLTNLAVLGGLILGAGLLLLLALRSAGAH